MKEEELDLPTPREEVIEEEYPTRRGILKTACSCGETSNLSDEVIENGLSWSMIIGNDHHLTLMCPKCNAKLKMFIEEIHNGLPEESVKE